MELNRTNIEAMSRGVKTIFNNSFKGIKPEWEKVAMAVHSDSTSESYPWLDSFPFIREWLGDRVIQNLSTATYEIKNKDFEGTIGIDRNAMKDDKFGVYKPAIQQLGQAAAEFPDQLVFGLLKNGFTTPCFDGQYFFDSDHPGFDATGAEISASNMQAGSGAPWFLLDTSQAIKPLVYQEREKFTLIAKDSVTDDNLYSGRQFQYGVDGRCNAGYGFWQFAFGSKADLTEANYELARAAMMSLRRKNGSALNIRPTLWVGPASLEGAARRLFKNEMGASGSTNPWFNSVDILVTPLVA